jgi:hypothetical protein
MSKQFKPKRFRWFCGTYFTVTKINSRSIYFRWKSYCCPRCGTTVFDECESIPAVKMLARGDIEGASSHAFTSFLDVNRDINAAVRCAQRVLKHFGVEW